MSRKRYLNRQKLRMPHITAKSSSTEVQTAANHDRTAWRRFLRITAEEGQALVTRYGLKGSWRDFENNLQRELKTRVNDRLAREDIPQVTEKIIDWRMAQVMKDRKATKATRNSSDTVSEADSALSNEHSPRRPEPSSLAPYSQEQFLQQLPSTPMISYYPYATSVQQSPPAFPEQSVPNQMQMPSSPRQATTDRRQAMFDPVRGCIRSTK